MFPGKTLIGLRLIYSYFQSPFSGDFLCFFNTARNCGVRRKWLSISIFRRFSLFRTLTVAVADVDEAFQSPFSGDFLCFLSSHILFSLSILSFNLHFQEIFFVSIDMECAYMKTVVIFQSPFSGDFLCFPVRNNPELSPSKEPFNLHFQEIFFVSNLYAVPALLDVIPFNLHFQEIFFVSKH